MQNTTAGTVTHLGYAAGYLVCVPKHATIKQARKLIAYAIHLARKRYYLHGKCINVVYSTKGFLVLVA